MEREQLKGKQTPGTCSELGGFVSVTDKAGDKWISAGMIRHGKRGFAEVYNAPFGGFQDGFYYATKEQNAANAALYAEAHNVANTTGMWPLDLVARIKELEEELNYIREQGRDLPI